MENVLVYCETENQQVADVSLELLTKGKALAGQLGVKLDAFVAGSGLDDIAAALYPYGADRVFVADDKGLAPFTTLPHSKLFSGLIQQEKPQIVLIGASNTGRDLAPHVASTLECGLTADCTSLEIGDHYDKKSQKEYKNILYQIRPAFGGSIIATIISPDHRPQMATVREGVMKNEVYGLQHKGQRIDMPVRELLSDADFPVEVIARQLEAKNINIKNAQIIVAGGYGMGSKENFDLLYELAKAIGGEVGASRAAVDAGFAPKERQVGQTGITVRPKLYIACGISGAVQHRAGMDQSAIIISVNTDESAPINAIADYYIHGDAAEVVPKLTQYYHKNAQ